jgi:hypothetical protein
MLKVKERLEHGIERAGAEFLVKAVGEALEMYIGRIL